jgi:cytochrome c biogenesis protein
MQELNVKAGEKEKGFLAILLDLFRSVKLTISLLILLAILSILGTLIKQNAASSEYVQRYGAGLCEVLNFFNLFDMYHSWWFSAILLLLVINLIACSLHRLPGIMSQVSRGSGSGELKDAMLKSLPYVERIQISGPAKREDEIRFYLRRWSKDPKRTETELTITLYSEKGRFSRLGVPITHLSILIILIGGLLGSIYGFKGFVNILEGETADRIYLRMKDKETPKPLDFSVRCDDFKITYYDIQRPERLVKEYRSLLTILEDGKEVLRKTVVVNHPLHYKGLAFYQSSYGTLNDVTLGIQWKDKKDKNLVRTFEGETIPIPNSNTFLRVLKYAPQIHNFGEGVQVVLMKPNREPRAFWVLKGFPQFGQPRDDEFVLTFEGVSSREYTGLQVTKDPGVWVVWTGCALMVLGLIISFFFSHQRVWVRMAKNSAGEMVLAGSANKNRIGFEKAFGQLVDEVRSSGQKSS